LALASLTGGRDGLTNYAVEIGVGAMIYIPSFIKISSGIQNVKGRGARPDIQRHTDRKMIS
jgi:hypothetical protein